RGGDPPGPEKPWPGNSTRRARYPARSPSQGAQTAAARLTPCSITSGGPAPTASTRSRTLAVARSRNDSWGCRPLSANSLVSASRILRSRFMLFFLSCARPSWLGQLDPVHRGPPPPRARGGAGDPAVPPCLLGRSGQPGGRRLRQHRVAPLLCERSLNVWMEHCATPLLAVIDRDNFSVGEKGPGIHRPGALIGRGRILIRECSILTSGR